MEVSAVRCRSLMKSNNSENKPVVYITGKFMKNGKFKTNATDSNTVLLFKDPGAQLNLGGWALMLMMTWLSKRVQK